MQKQQWYSGPASKSNSYLENAPQSLLSVFGAENCGTSGGAPAAGGTSGAAPSVGGGDRSARRSRAEWFGGFVGITGADGCMLAIGFTGLVVADGNAAGWTGDTGLILDACCVLVFGPGGGGSRPTAPLPLGRARDFSPPSPDILVCKTLDVVFKLKHLQHLQYFTFSCTCTVLHFPKVQSLSSDHSTVFQE